MTFLLRPLPGFIAANAVVVAVAVLPMILSHVI
jgi:hypothetical protein